VSEFFAMGGYAPYVWSTFGITLVVLVINVIAAKRRLRQVREQLKLRAARDARRRNTT
jgi:heme exporter protein D